MSTFNFAIEGIAIFRNQCIHTFFGDFISGFLYPFFACALLKGCKHSVICGVGFCSSVDSCIFRFFIRIYGSSGHPTSKHLAVDVFRICRSFNSSTCFKNWFLHFSTVHHPSVGVCWDKRCFVFYKVVAFVKFVGVIEFLQNAIANHSSTNLDLWVFGISVFCIFLVTEELELWSSGCSIVRHIESDVVVLCAVWSDNLAHNTLYIHRSCETFTSINQRNCLFYGVSTFFSVGNSLNSYRTSSFCAHAAISGSSGYWNCTSFSECSRSACPSGFSSNIFLGVVIVSGVYLQTICAESITHKIFFIGRFASDCKWFHSFLWFRTVCIGNRDRLDVECTSSISKRDAYIARSWKFFHRNRLCTILVTAPSGSRLLKNDFVAHFNGAYMIPFVTCTRNRHRWNLFSRKSTSRQCHLFWSLAFA